MSAAEALKEVDRLAIDSAPLIYLVEEHARYVGALEEVVDLVDARELQLSTSVLTLTEVLVRPKACGRPDLEARYLELLGEVAGVDVIDVTRQVALRAAELRVKHRLRTPDAIHIASALVARCTAFLTNDKAMRRVNDLRVVVLDDLL